MLFVDVLSDAHSSLGGEFLLVEFKLGVHTGGEVCHALELFCLLTSTDPPPYEEEERLCARWILAVEIPTVLEFFALLAIRPFQAVGQDLIVCLVYEAWQIHPNTDEHPEKPQPHKAKHLDKP